MSKHIDLIAVGALLVAFAFAARVHDKVYFGVGQTRMFRLRQLNPIVVTRPRLPDLPRVSY